MPAFSSFQSPDQFSDSPKASGTFVDTLQRMRKVLSTSAFCDALAVLLPHLDGSTKGPPRCKAARDEVDGNVKHLTLEMLVLRLKCVFWSADRWSSACAIKLKSADPACLRYLGRTTLPNLTHLKL